MFKPDDFMSAKEVCELLCITRMTLYRWVIEGKVTQYKPGRTALFVRSEIEKLLLNSVKIAS